MEKTLQQYNRYQRENSNGSIKTNNNKHIDNENNKNEKKLVYFLWLHLDTNDQIQKAFVYHLRHRHLKGEWDITDFFND